jgi:hypothetical protein
MKPISEESIYSVASFAKNLTADQLKDLYIRINEKQPHMYQYFKNFISKSGTKETMALLPYIFLLLIRTYEYEYGELELIDIATINDGDDELFKVMKKANDMPSMKKVELELAMKADQAPFIQFLESLIDGIKANKSQNALLDKMGVKLGLYITMVILNSVVESNEKMV